MVNWMNWCYINESMLYHVITSFIPPSRCSDSTMTSHSCQEP